MKPADYANRAFAEAQKAGDEILIVQTLLMRARVYRGQHDLAHSDAMLALAEPRMRKVFPPDITPSRRSSLSDL